MVVAGAAMLVPVFVLPIGGRQIGPPVSFMPAVLSVVAYFDIMSAYLLVGDYRDRGDPRLLVMACAHSWSLTVMGGYQLAFPGVVSPHPRWHSSFPGCRHVIVDAGGREGRVGGLGVIGRESDADGSGRDARGPRFESESR